MIASKNDFPHSLFEENDINLKLKAHKTSLVPLLPSQLRKDKQKYMVWLNKLQ